MKKFLFFVILFSVTVLGSQAQDQFKSKFGIKGGLNFAGTSYVNRDDVKSGYITGVNFGIFYDRYLFSILSIQPELNFSNGGSISEVGTVLGTIRTTNYINYLTLPVSLKANIDLRGGLVFNVYGGVYIAYGGSGSSKTEGVGQERTVDIIGVTAYDGSTNDKAQVNALDYGGQVGAGFSLDIISALSLIADVRYSFGFREVSRYSDTYKNGLPTAETELAEGKNRILSGSLGLALKF